MTNTIPMSTVKVNQLHVQHSQGDQLMQNREHYYNLESTVSQNQLLARKPNAVLEKSMMQANQLNLDVSNVTSMNEGKMVALHVDPISVERDRE